MVSSTCLANGDIILWLEFQDASGSFEFFLHSIASVAIEVRPYLPSKLSSAGRQTLHISEGFLSFLPKTCQRKGSYCGAWTVIFRLGNPGDGEEVLFLPSPCAVSQWKAVCLQKKKERDVFLGWFALQLSLIVSGPVCLHPGWGKTPCHHLQLLIWLYAQLSGRWHTDLRFVCFDLSCFPSRICSNNLGYSILWGNSLHNGG